METPLHVVQNYSGGFASIVKNPTLLTYSFFRYWFTGNRSLGSAMDILGLPCQKIPYPLLERYGKVLTVDLLAEEKILYSNTVFCFKPHKNLTQIPELTICFPKMISPVYWIGTLRLLFTQSLWISFPGAIEKTCRIAVRKIPMQAPLTDFQNREKILIHSVWPGIIATEYVTDFFESYLDHIARSHKQAVEAYMKLNTPPDWFSEAVTDMGKVKNKEMSLSYYLKRYGLLADEQFELTCPRWHEIPDVIEQRIHAHEFFPPKKTMQHISLPEKLRKLADIVIECRILRSEAKHKALGGFDGFRQSLLQQFGSLASPALSRMYIYEDVTDTSL